MARWVATLTFISYDSVELKLQNLTKGFYAPKNSMVKWKYSKHLHFIYILYNMYILYVSMSDMYTFIDNMDT